MNKPRKRWFTLIELMIVVAIVAILAAVAYPSYQAHVIRTSQALANGCLLELSQFMERYYTTNISYAGGIAGNRVPKIPLPRALCLFAFQAAPAANQFTIQATPGGAQAADTCSTLDKPGGCSNTKYSNVGGRYFFCGRLQSLPQIGGCI